jgi:hypothetical protein
MHERSCPRCGTTMASAEFLGQVVEALSTGDTGVARLLEAMRAAAASDVPWLMSQVEREAPGLAAALGCYVGTCRPIRSGTPAR